MGQGKGEGDWVGDEEGFVIVISAGGNIHSPKGKCSPVDICSSMCNSLPEIIIRYDAIYLYNILIIWLPF